MAATRPQLELSEKPVAIIAGNGDLPFEIADILKQRGQKFTVVGIRSEVDPRISDYQGRVLDWGELGSLLTILGEFNARDIVFAGGVSRRPSLTKFLFDWDVMKALPEVLIFMAGGDNSVLNGTIQLFAKRGFIIRGIHEVAPELLARDGLNAGPKPSRADHTAMDVGFSVTAELGRFDVGQGAVVVGTRAVALEGAEGTDEMLRRIADLKISNRLPSKKSGVLVKRSKPGQDLRADLPTIGPRTIKLAATAGLRGIGVEADRTLIVYRESTFSLCKQHDVFIYARPATPEAALAEERS
ncbi:MAG: UDP-2,3-diacylglucosamine diphosphatase LpxI [Pseudomonadota bacterium]